MTLMIKLPVLSLLLACALSALAGAKTVKVFILAGQSNMEGKGLATHLDTYRDDAQIKPWYGIIKDGEGWAERKDVFITYPTKSGGAKHGPLTVDYGTKGENSIGPEFGFGHAVGKHYREPVLIIKIAWGGKSVYGPFRPPSGRPSDRELREMIETKKKDYEADLAVHKRKVSEGKNSRKPKPVPTFDELKKTYGESYDEMVRHVKRELADFENKFPQLKGYRPELAGFVWHQGFNDMVNGYYKERGFGQYTKWLGMLIMDLRRDLGAPRMPVVIGELSTGGVEGRGPFQTAQAQVAELPAIKGTVTFVPTAEFQDKVALRYFKEGVWKKGEEGMAKWMTVGNDRPYHYLGSGKTYFLKGVAFAKAAIQLDR